MVANALRARCGCLCGNCESVLAGREAIVVGFVLWSSVWCLVRVAAALCFESLTVHSTYVSPFQLLHAK